MNRYEFALFVQHENLTVPFQGEGRKAEVREASGRKRACSGCLLSQPIFLGLSRSLLDTIAHCTILTQKHTQSGFSLGVHGLAWKWGNPKEPSARG